MHFPLLRDIATTQIISIDINNTVCSALEKMIDSSHRDIIITDSIDGTKQYYILTALDIMAIRETNTKLDLLLTEIPLETIPTLNKEQNILETLSYIQKSMEYLIIIDDDQQLFGLVTHSDIISHIDPETLMDNYRLTDFLKIGKRMKWVNKGESTATILLQMSKKKFDNVVIVEDNKPIGILTTKDIITLIQSKKELSEPVASYMSSPVKTIESSASVKDALNFIKKSHFKRIIVVDNNGNLSGIVSQKELISLTYTKWANLMKEYQQELFEINQMLEKKTKKFQKIASMDSLTGLYTRYKFSELYISLYKTMLQRQNSLCIIMLDIDFFKKVNDTFGHNIGDTVLVQTAHVLLRNLRNIDVICRWGGEEFIILLPTADTETTMTIAEKLRSSISQNNVETVGCVQASFGVTNVIAGDSMEDAVARADKALYEAKSDGRNCVKLHLA